MKVIGASLGIQIILLSLSEDGTLYHKTNSFGLNYLYCDLEWGEGIQKCETCGEHAVLINLIFFPRKEPIFEAQRTR